MSKSAKTKDSPSRTDIDPAKEYRVRFKRLHKQGRVEFKPLHAYYMSGRALEALPADKIASFEVAEPLQNG